MKQLFCMFLVGCSYFAETSTPVHQQPPDAPSPFPPVDAGEPSPSRRVFVTSATYQGGALGGWFGANAICQRHADLASLGGTWRAWLSGTGAYPNNAMDHHDANYRLVTGEGVDDVLAHGWADLVDGSLRVPINVTELGMHHQAAPSSCMNQVVAWTNTSWDGDPIEIPNQDYSCGGWQDLAGQGAVGGVDKTGVDWTYLGCALPCSAFAALYCVEQ